MDAAEVRQLFPGLKDTIYLNTATMNVGCAPAKAAYELAVERWSAAGSTGWTPSGQGRTHAPCSPGSSVPRPPRSPSFRP